MEDMTMPNSDERLLILAKDIKDNCAEIADIKSRHVRNRQDWVNANITLAENLLAAKRPDGKHEIPTQEFGQWCADSGFGEDVLDRNTRAVLIDMAADPTKMRALLEASDSWSVRVICARNSRLHNAVNSAGKPDEIPPQEGWVSKSVRMWYHPDDWKAFGREAREHDTSKSVMLGELVERYVNGGSEPASLPMTSQKKLDAAVRQETRRLEAEHATRVRNLDEEVRQRVLAEGAAYRETMQERESKARRTESLYREFLNNNRKIFTVDDYTAILRCLHPDSRDAVTQSRLSEAFRLLSDKKFQLTGKKD